MTEQEIDQRFASICREMIDAWKVAPAPDKRPLPDDSRLSRSEGGAIAVVWGWTACVARTAEAVLLLSKSGFDAETAPMVRSMLEHSVAIWWMVDKRGPAYQTLVRARSRSMQLFKDAQASGWRLDAEMARLLDNAISVETDPETVSGDYLVAARRRADEYGFGATHQAWLVETWMSHPTLMSAQPYFNHDEAGSTTLYLVPKPTGRKTLAAVTSALHSALAGYAQVASDAFSDNLARWAAEFEAAGDALRNLEASTDDR